MQNVHVCHYWRKTKQAISFTHLTEALNVIQNKPILTVAQKQKFVCDAGYRHEKAFDHLRPIPIPHPSALILDPYSLFRSWPNRAKVSCVIRRMRNSGKVALQEKSIHMQRKV